MYNHLFAFEKLQVWQDARKLTQLVYTITSKFPPQEQYGLISQIRRAKISIASNIAEGSGRVSAKDQAHFYQMAYSSALELYNQFIKSNNLNMNTEEELNAIKKQIEMVTNKLIALRKSRLNS